jgi:hypothetical protein
LDRKVRLGYLPEGDDDGLWRISAYADPFAQPHWGVCFNDMTPTEFVTEFTTALAHSYTDGPDSYLTGPAQPAFDAVVPAWTSCASASSSPADPRAGNNAAVTVRHTCTKSDPEPSCRSQAMDGVFGTHSVLSCFALLLISKCANWCLWCSYLG